MESNLEIAVTIVNNSVYSEFERIWGEVTDVTVPEYRVLIWGSIVDDRDRDPVDMDVLIEYMGDPIEPDQEKSIESWLKSAISISQYSYVDPLVIHYSETPSVVSQSRVSRVYSVDESGWVEF